jgi:hypothetical protein
MQIELKGVPVQLPYTADTVAAIFVVVSAYR